MFELEGGGDRASDQRPVTKASCRLPCSGWNDVLRRLSLRQLGAEHVAVLFDHEFEWCPRVVVPDLRGIHSVPSRPLARLKQEIDRGAVASGAVFALVPPGLPVVTALGMWSELELSNDVF